MTTPSGPPARGALLDARGCLTTAGLAALAGAPVGRAPSDLAAHLAGCPRCQQRMLSEGTGARTPGPRREPRLWLGLAVGLAALLLSMAALILAARLR
jgi:hypothetical protein